MGFFSQIHTLTKWILLFSQQVSLPPNQTDQNTRALVN